MNLTLVGGRVLAGGALHETNVRMADGVIADVGVPAAGATLDVRGLLVLPGLVDIHGDAFERQIMPRPGVRFPMDMALLETDRQLVANGICTAYHGLTWSWEPGLRGREAAHAFVQSLRRLRPHLMADARLHLRWEAFNFAAADEVVAWLGDGRIDLLAFNNHLPGDYEKRDPAGLRKLADRTGLTPDDYIALMEQLWAARDQVTPALERLAVAARAAGVPMLSHDDESPERRTYFHALGCAVAEFPETAATAEQARTLGNAIVFGAPNVVRGGSHTGNVGAAAMVAAGLCTVLASDYYYPALLAAPFRLARDGVCDLPAAWTLVAAGPAQAAGLHDRGRIAPGLRADLVVVDASGPLPRVVATIVAGRPVYRTDGLH